MMLEECKNTMTYSYIEHALPLSQLRLGEGLFCVLGLLFASPFYLLQV